METPAHTKETAESVIDNLLPEKSGPRYWKAYDEFQKWSRQ